MEMVRPVAGDFERVDIHQNMGSRARSIAKFNKK